MSHQIRSSILITDDQKINRVLLKQIFVENFNVVEAQDGVEAMQKLESTDISAVVLDLMMPRMDGFEVLRRMRLSETLRRVPVIVVTGSEDLEMQNRALDLGALDVMIKPFNPKIVHRRVINLIERMEAASIVEQNKWRAELERVRETDERTGIWNKATFLRETGHVLRQQSERAFVLVRWDIDRFSVFNDMFGMDEGDRLLKRIGDSLKTSKDIPEKVGMVTYGHWDADHFVCLWDAARLNAAALCAYTERRLAELYPTYTFGIRFGLYEIDDPTLDVGVMCDRAFMALRSVKASYGTRIAWYDASMRQALLDEMEITSVMKDALMAGEFEPFYQPQYNFDSGEMIGAEALVRWRKPDGYIAPSQFIPVFEKNGFILEMDLYIWERVCADMKRWRAANLKLPSVSVNVSRRDLHHPRLAGILSAMVAKYGLEPSALHLEITESAYMDNPEQLLHTVDELKLAGFRVEIDDFGSGYSSLNTLKDVPVDLLKMDMRFMTKAAQHGRGGSIVSSVVRMAHSISLPVIAEGVETIEHAQYLSSIGCPYMQGYYFAHPMTASAFTDMLSGNDMRFWNRTVTETGVDDAADFLEADTQSTLLFNSFLGGAGILEYNNNHVFALRLNDRFFETLGTTRLYWDGHQTHLLKIWLERDLERFVAMIKQAIETGDEASCELCSAPVEEGAPPDDVWTFCRVRSLAYKAGSYILYLSVENITQRKALAKHNEELSAHLSAIINSAPGGVQTFQVEDGVVRMTYANTSTATMFGFSQDELPAMLERDPMASVHPDDVVTLWKFIIDGRRRAYDTITLRFRHICKNGAWRWVQMTCSVITRQESALTVSAIMMDIDSQMHSERLNVLYGNMIQSLPLGLLAYESGRSGEPMYINDIAKRCLGQDGVTNKALTEWLGSQLEKTIYRPGDMKKLDDGELVEHTHVPIRGANGEMRYLRVIAHGDRREDGPLSIYVALVDSTDTVRAEQHAQAQTERLRERQAELRRESNLAMALIKNTPGGIICLRFTHGIAHVEYVSASLCRLMGHSESDLSSFMSSVDADDAAFIHPDDRELVRRAQARTVNLGEPFDEQYRIMRHDGSYVWARMYGVFVGDQPGEGMLYGSYLDISELKRMEDDLARDRREIDTLINAIPGGIATYEVLERGLKPVFVSEGMARLIGRDPGQSGALSLSGLSVEVWPHDEPMVLSAIEECVRHGRALDVTFRARHADGRLIWLNLRGALSGEYNGRPMLYAVYHNLSSATDLYQQVVNASENLLLVADRNTREILFMNSAAMKRGMAHGAPPEGMTCNQYLFGCEGRCAFCLLDKLDADPLDQDIEHDGHHYRSHMKRIDWNGRDAFIISREDVTEEVAAKRRFDAVLRGAPGGLSVFRVFGEHITRTYLSEGANRILGYLDDETPMANIAETYARVHADDRAPVIEAVRQAIENHADLNVDMRILPAHGAERWVNLSAVYSVDESGVTEYYGLYTDVTQRRRMEESLRVKQDLYRIVAAQTGRKYYLYDTVTREAIFESEADRLPGDGERMPDFAEVMVRRGTVAPDSARAWLAFFRQIEAGDASGTARVHFQYGGGEYWFLLNFTAIPGSDSGRVVISYENITAARELSKSHMQLRTGMYQAVSALYAIVTTCNLTRNEYRSLKREPGDPRESGEYDALFAAESTAVPPIDREAYTAAFSRENACRAFEEGKQTLSLEHRRVDRDGVTHWSETLLLRSTNAYDDDILAVALLRDIDARKTMEESLRSELSSASGALEARAYYGHLADKLVPGFMSVRYQDARETVYTLGNVPCLGLDSDELAKLNGGDLLALCLPEDAEAARAARERAECEGVPYYDLEYRVKTKDGGVAWMEQRSRRFVDKSGRAGYASIVVDDTEDRLMRDRLRMSEEETRLSMEQMGKMICRYDIGTRTLTVPARYARLHGIPEICVGMPDCPEVLERLKSHPNVIIDLRRFFKRIHMGEPSGGGEINFIRTGNASRWERGEFIVIPDEAGRHVRAVIAIEDTTALHAQSDENERLRFSTQLLSVVNAHSERIVYYYDASRRVVRAMDAARSRSNGLPAEYTVPVLRQGEHLSHEMLFDDTLDTLRALFMQIERGEAGGSARLHIHDLERHDKWFDLRFSTLPEHKDGTRDAVLSLLDITALHEQELQFISYQQAMERNISSCLLYIEADLRRDIVLRLDGRMMSEFPSVGLRDRDKVITAFLARFRDSAAALRVRSFFDRDRLMRAFKSGTRNLRETFELKREGVSAKYLRTETLLLEDPYTHGVRSITLVYDETEERERRRAAETDALTGLMNRGAIETRIRQSLEQREGKTCTLVLLDLDNLKAINDTFGHQVGDRALRTLADHMRAHFRSTDMIARIGGDEFFVFLRDAGSQSDIRYMMAAFMRLIAQTRVGDQGQWPMRVSSGCASAVSGQADFHQLYKNADIALSNVKRNGKNDFALYTPEMLLPGYRFKGHARLTLAGSEMQDPREVRRLLAALSRFFTFVVALQPHQNLYTVMETPDALAARLPGAGTLKELSDALLPCVPEEQRALVSDTLRAATLIQDIQEGKRGARVSDNPSGDSPSDAPFTTHSRLSLTWMPPGEPARPIEALILSCPGEPGALRLFVLARAADAEGGQSLA